MYSPLDTELDRLSDELARLTKETAELTRNYPLADAYDMQSGKPRPGAPENERIARERFARMREVVALINAHQGN